MASADGDVQVSLLPTAPADTPEDGVPATWDMKRAFPTTLSVILAVLIACFAVFTKYSDTGDTEEFYMFYVHVSVMIFVGFGFLMTFLRRYSLSAVSLNFAASCMMLLTDVLLHGAFKTKFDSLQFASVSLESLIQGLFCAGAGMISFGALLGKVSPTQLVLLLLLEVPLYAFNAEVLVGGIFDKLGAQDFGGSIAIHAFGAYLGLAASRVLPSDFGGSIAIHAFGAYFGLAASLVLFCGTKGAGSSHPKNKCDYVHDVTAMVGTIFLWVYWPSFNAAIATASGDADTGVVTGALRMYATVNTVLSLCGATLSTFISCSFLRGKLDMVLVQNATLAGGVAVGSATVMVVGPRIINVTPGGAVAVGALAGLLSSWGFVCLSPYLEVKIGLKDTCGVHNLHGMPGVFGGLVPVFVMLLAGEPGAAGAQAAAVGCTLALAGVGGAVAGYAVSLLGGANGDAAVDAMFEDKEVFVAEEEDEE